jgi:hypothetical protein
VAIAVTLSAVSVVVPEKALVSFLVGALFMAYGWYRIHIDLRLDRGGQSAAAEVVDMKRIGSGRGDEDGTGRYYPVVAFRTADGQEVRAPTKYGSYPPPAQVGEQVPVIYDPAVPTLVKLDRPHGQQTVFALVFGTVGGALLVYAVFLMTR